MAEKQPEVIQLFGPPPEEPHTNIMEPRVCVADGGPCRCGDGGRGFRVIEPSVFVRSDKFRAELNQKYDEELLETENPSRVLGIRDARLRAGEDCPRKPRLH